MSRDLASKIRSHINSWEVERTLIIRSLGMKPRNGGSPPNEKRAMNEAAFSLVSVISLICLKWKI